MGKNLPFLYVKFVTVDIRLLADLEFFTADALSSEVAELLSRKPGL